MPSKVYATEIDTKKPEELRAEVAKRKLQNVVVVESKEADTNLPTACCDAIFGAACTITSLSQRSLTPT